MLAKAPPGSPPARKRILVVDDHPMLRRGLTALLESEPGLAVCAEATTAESALEAVMAHSPDLVIVDLMLEGSDGLELVKKMKQCCPDLPALVLTMHDEAVYAERALRAGARGYVSKQQLDDTVLEAVLRVLDGGTYMSDKLRERLAARYVDGRTLAADSPLGALSDRELQVFRLVGEGAGSRRIAQDLNLSVKTVESHLEHIKRKLGLASATVLAQRAIRWVETGGTG